MKRYLIAIAAIIMFTSPALAGNQVRLSEYTDREGTRMVYSLPEEMLADVPEWKTDGELPLPAHKAVEIATKWFMKKHPEFKGFFVRAVEVSRISSWEYQDRWYYSVVGRAIVDDEGTREGPFHYAFILMDGTVIEPRKADPL